MSADELTLGANDDVQVLDGVLLPRDGRDRVDLHKQAAHGLVERVRTSCVDVLRCLQALYDGRAWISLGYDSWADLCQAEFAGAVGWTSAVQRSEIVIELRSTGMSIRGIAAAVGISPNTVRKDVCQSDTPAVITTGTDGKSYDAPAPRPQRRPSFADCYRNAISDLDKVRRRLQDLHGDDRFAGHREELADHHSRLFVEINLELDTLMVELGRGDRYPKREANHEVTTTASILPLLLDER